MSNKPKIFVFNNHPSPGCNLAEALSEDGVFLGQHCCSDEGYIPHDMGATSDWHHDTYRKYYPDGFDVVYCRATDDCVNEAYKKHLAMTEEEYAEKTKCLKGHCLTAGATLEIERDGVISTIELKT